MSGDARTRGVRLVMLGVDQPERDCFRLAFGRNLKLLRIAARLSQETLAARCFLRPDHVSRLECGGAPPSLELLLLLGDALGVPVEDLTESLATPVRAASLERMRALIAEQPGSGTRALVRSTELPESYVFQLVRYLESYGQIHRESGGWQTREIR